MFTYDAIEQLANDRGVSRRGQADAWRRARAAEPTVGRRSWPVLRAARRRDLAVSTGLRSC